MNLRLKASLPTARECNVFTGVCLSTIGLTDIGSLLGLVTARLVRILLECFLVSTILMMKTSENGLGFYFLSIS